VTGSAGLTFTDISIIPAVGEKVCFAVDLTVGGTYQISLETDAEVPFNFSGELLPYVPLDLNQLEVVVNPDCGEGSGSIAFFGGDYQDVLVSFHFPVNGVNQFNEVINLPFGVYAVNVTDLFCASIDTLIFNIEVPDGTFTPQIETVTPVYNCLASSTSDGSIEGGGFTGTVTGGFGPFNTVVNGWPGSELNNAPNFGFDGITQAGQYTALVTDESSGCQSLLQVDIPEEDVELTVELVSVLGLLDGQYGPILPGEIQVDVITDVSNPDITYTWSPAGGINDQSGGYTAIVNPGNYTVTAELTPSGCQASLTVELPYDLCTLTADLNSDGVVNSADLLSFLNYYGQLCEGCLGDLNQDGIVNTLDLLILLGQMNSSCLD
jgi:hypothetical protein